jgi:hypothetical protein
MLVGSKYGSIRDYYYIQTNNAVEHIIKAIKQETIDKLMEVGVSQSIIDQIKLRSYLESCGANSVVNACANLLGPSLPGIQLPSIFPGWPRGPQLDDIAMLCFSDPNNAAEVVKAIKWIEGETVMENRYMQLHPVIARIMFGIHAEWGECRTYREIYNSITAGNSVGILLPGHYVSAGIVDDLTGDLRIKDSWPNRKPEWKGDGFLQALTQDEFSTVKQTVVYYKPGR